MENIFLSYCWDNEKEANDIDDFFLKEGIKLKRDIRELNYTENIDEFMKKIRESDFYILVLSEHYFKSKNCMKELFEALKEKEFQKKVLPIVVQDGFYSNQIIINILNYWTEKEKEEEEKLKNINPIIANKLFREVNEITKIKIEIVDNMTFLQKMLLTTLEKEKECNFKTLLKKINSLEIKPSKLEIEESEIFKKINIPNLKELTLNDKNEFLFKNFMKMLGYFEEVFLKVKLENMNFDFEIKDKNEIKLIEIKINNKILKRVAFWIDRFGRTDSIFFRSVSDYETEITKNSWNGQIGCEVNSLTKNLELKSYIGIYNSRDIDEMSLEILKNYFLNELESYSQKVRF